MKNEFLVDDDGQFCVMSFSNEFDKLKKKVKMFIPWTVEDTVLYIDEVTKNGLEYTISKDLFLYTQDGILSEEIIDKAWNIINGRNK